MRFTDTHVHFWDTALMPCPWLSGVPSIAGAHTPDQLHEDSAGEMPSRIVFVECGSPWLDEVKWVEKLALAEPRIRGIVAKAPMNEGAKTAAAIAELARHPLVRGVRHNFQHEADPSFCSRPEFIEGVSRLHPANLSFDICCFHFQLDAVIELVSRCPQTSFILDHAGKPGIKAGTVDPWRSQIKALAKLPNVVCKLSGLVTEADHSRWTAADLKPYVETLLEAFGPSRLLFGGDWPVAKLASSYPRWLETAREFTAQLSPADQAAIFEGNASRIYRLL
jgi:L-fuconolactonase